jgi:succinate dehydrogenase / fumarate reductase, membrane anchor subunit
MMRPPDTPRPPRGRRQVFWWLLQRISGAALILLAGIHIWVTHWQHPGVVPPFEGVVGRLRTATFIAVDFSLLFFGLFHALNGMRNILWDHVRGERALRIGTIALVAIGLLFAAGGSVGLLKIILAD